MNDRTRGAEERVYGSRAAGAKPYRALRKRGKLRIPVKVITHSGGKVISESGQSDHRSERSDAGVG